MRKTLFNLKPKRSTSYFALCFFMAAFIMAALFSIGDTHGKEGSEPDYTPAAAYVETPTVAFLEMLAGTYEALAEEMYDGAEEDLVGISYVEGYIEQAMPELTEEQMAAFWEEQEEQLAALGDAFLAYYTQFGYMPIQPFFSPDATASNQTQLELAINTAPTDGTPFVIAINVPNLQMTAAINIAGGRNIHLVSAGTNMQGEGPSRFTITAVSGQRHFGIIGNSHLTLTNIILDGGHTGGQTGLQQETAGRRQAGAAAAGSGRDYRAAGHGSPVH